MCTWVEKTSLYLIAWGAAAVAVTNCSRLRVLLSMFGLLVSTLSFLRDLKCAACLDAVFVDGVAEKLQCNFLYQKELKTFPLVHFHKIVWILHVLCTDKSVL